MDRRDGQAKDSRPWDLYGPALQVAALSISALVISAHE